MPKSDTIASAVGLGLSAADAAALVESPDATPALAAGLGALLGIAPAYVAVTDIALEGARRLDQAQVPGQREEVNRAEKRFGHNARKCV